MKKQIKLLSMILLVFALVSFSACSLKKNTPAINDNTPSSNIVVDAVYTLSEINVHSVEDDCWTVIDGQVYDLTSYIASGKHKPIIVEGCGIDSTTLFNDINKHNTTQTKNMLSSMKIGSLAQ